jgi:hypothetical protein
MTHSRWLTRRYLPAAYTMYIHPTPWSFAARLLHIPRYPSPTPCTSSAHLLDLPLHSSYALCFCCSQTKIHHASLGYRQQALHRKPPFNPVQPGSHRRPYSTRTIMDGSTSFGSRARRGSYTVRSHGPTRGTMCLGAFHSYTWRSNGWEAQLPDLRSSRGMSRIRFLALHS